MKFTLAKLIKFMSLQCLIVATIQVLTMQFLIAEELNGQSVRETKVSVNISGKTLPEIFRIIEKETDFVFAYTDAIKQAKQTYSFTFRNTTLEAVLNRLRQEAKLKFRVI